MAMNVQAGWITNITGSTYGGEQSSSLVVMNSDLHIFYINRTDSASGTAQYMNMSSGFKQTKAPTDVSSRTSIYAFNFSNGYSRVAVMNDVGGIEMSVYNFTNEDFANNINHTYAWSEYPNNLPALVVDAEWFDDTAWLLGAYYPAITNETSDWVWDASPFSGLLCDEMECPEKWSKMTANNNTDYNLSVIIGIATSGYRIKEITKQSGGGVWSSPMDVSTREVTTNNVEICSLNGTKYYFWGTSINYGGMLNYTRNTTVGYDTESNLFNPEGFTNMSVVNIICVPNETLGKIYLYFFVVNSSAVANNMLSFYKMNYSLATNSWSSPLLLDNAFFDVNGLAWAFGTNWAIYNNIFYATADIARSGKASILDIYLFNDSIVPLAAPPAPLFTGTIKNSVTINNTWKGSNNFTFRIILNSTNFIYNQSNNLSSLKFYNASLDMSKPLNYYIVNNSPTANTMVDVRVTDFVANNSLYTIWFYWNETDTTNMSAFNTAYMFADDFTTATLNYSKFILINTSVGIKFQNNILNATAGTSGGWNKMVLMTAQNFTREDGLTFYYKISWHNIVITSTPYSAVGWKDTVTTNGLTSNLWSSFWQVSWKLGRCTGSLCVSSTEDYAFVKDSFYDVKIRVIGGGGYQGYIKASDDDTTLPYVLFNSTATGTDTLLKPYFNPADSGVTYYSEHDNMKVFLDYPSSLMVMNFGSPDNSTGNVTVDNPPVITINSPLNTTMTVSSRSTLITLNFTVIDDINTSLPCWKSVDNAANVSIGNVNNGSTYQESINFSTAGSHSIAITCQDSLPQNSTNATYFTEIIDSPPSVNLSYPTNATIFVLSPTNQIDLNITVIDDIATSSLCWYSLNDAANVSLGSVSNNTLTRFNLTNVSTGSNHVYIICQDTFPQNSTSSVIYFTVNYYSLAITFNSQNPVDIDSLNLFGTDKFHANYTIQYDNDSVPLTLRSLTFY